MDIQEKLENLGYVYTDNQLSNVQSIEKLTSDILKILSDNIYNQKEIKFHKKVEFTSDEKKQFAFEIKEPFTYVIPDYDARRKIIGNSLFPNNKYPYFNDNKVLDDMFKYYDYYYFGNMIQYALNKTEGQIKFEFSDKMTSTGGTCSRTGICIYKIKISRKKLDEINTTNVNDMAVNGIIPRDKVDALQLIFEHELIHAVLSIFVNEISGHGQLFKDIARNLFGHTKTTHTIGTKNKQTAIFNKSNLKVGQQIAFMMKKEKIYGNILKLNPKRAKISTAKGVYSVPYDMLMM